MKNKVKRILNEFRLYDSKWELIKNKPDGYGLFTFPDTSFDITQHPLYKEADIINLHWTAKFLDYTSFFKNNDKKIVWTLHDMNPFTGGYHYSGICTGYTNNCNACPQLHPKIMTSPAKH